MKHQLVVPQKIKKELDKLPRRDRQKIVAGLSVLSGDPASGKKLQGEYAGQWSLRVWPYCLIYQIYKKNILILLIRKI